MATITTKLVCSECEYEVDPACYDDEAGMCENCYYDLYKECHNCYEMFDRNDCGDQLCPDCRANRWDNMAHANAPTDASWEDWSEFAEFTRTIDYGCKFDCEGECSGTREGDWRGSNGRGCCRDCAKNHGYLNQLPGHAVETVSNLYDDSKGFWRPGGCVLPVEYRSHICLTYCCHATSRKRNADTAGIELIHLHAKVLSRKGHLIRSEQRLQTAKANPSNNVINWDERVQSAQKDVAALTKKWKQTLEKVRVEKAAKAARAAFQEQMLQAGYFSELGYEVDSASVEQIMQRA